MSAGRARAGTLWVSAISVALGGFACGGADETDGAPAETSGTGGAFAATGGTSPAGGPGSGGALTGAGGIPLGAGGIPSGAGGVPIGAGGTPQGAGGIPIETGGAPSETGGTTGTGGATTIPPALTPVYRIPLRIHMALSNLTNADLGPILSELNDIWLSQGGICFEIEVTNDETNRADGFDFRYTAGQIPGATTANGVTRGAHDIWSIDHPNLGSAPNPVQNPASRTTAHELGHALNLDHENPPPSADCATPCYCVTLGLECNDFLMRSGRMGYFISDPEVQIARTRAAQRALPDTAPVACGAPVFNR
jgi:hypothetical protein